VDECKPLPLGLNCDTELQGISQGFQLRQGRPMELAPLLEVRASYSVARFNTAHFHRA
jgi:hypothetical protein